MSLQERAKKISRKIKKDVFLNSFLYLRVPFNLTEGQKGIKCKFGV
jgi:hypothetical protein